MTDLYDRGEAVLGHAERGIRWPYGQEDPPRRLRRTDPGKYERQRAETNARREILLSWAEHYGLRLSEAGCCPRWLLRGASQRCRPRSLGGDPCTHYGTPHPDSSWLDHTSAWLKDSRPAVLTAAPYDVEAQDLERLAHWERTDSRLRSATGRGWYGFGTTQIVLWRTDRIDEIFPADRLITPVASNGSNRV
jgi:hypothetical protein